ncbi:hypothetical protein GCM10010293_40630 [Streptomyces griseoflavus]|uniref:hypothetical protein n=1 Tax=Streptomyces griseoflavus TaxID=35619 RepID=UPI00167F1915|nr:hypothetical protein [Streptomyces griseoflavus]GGV36998.1 hypothetical protein GCM10010293_40630 [Streptomyces griseoflavus]
MFDIPDTVTETIRVGQLTAGRIIFLPMAGHRVEVESVRADGRYVHVDTTHGHAFMWLATDHLRALR